LFVNRARLAQRLLFCSGRIYDEIRKFSFLVERLLAAEPRAHSIYAAMGPAIAA